MPPAVSFVHVPFHVPDMLSEQERRMNVDNMPAQVRKVFIKRDLK